METLLCDQCDYIHRKASRHSYHNNTSIGVTPTCDHKTTVMYVYSWLYPYRDHHPVYLGSQYENVHYQVWRPRVWFQMKTTVNGKEGYPFNFKKNCVSFPTLVIILINLTRNVHFHVKKLLPKLVISTRDLSHLPEFSAKNDWYHKVAASLGYHCAKYFWHLNTKILTIIHGARHCESTPSAFFTQIYARWTHHFQRGRIPGSEARMRKQFPLKRQHFLAFQSVSVVLTYPR